jgi:tetratricopeptide (TPR) repeat protein
MPFLIVLAARGLVSLLDSMSAKATLRLAAGSLLAGLAFAATRSFPAPRDASEANGLTWLGIAEAKAGHAEKAIADFERAIELFPTSCDPEVGLAATLVDQHHVEAALAHFSRAVELCPDNVQALDAEADLLLKLGKVEEARAAAERSIAVAPHLARARYNLGRILLASQHAEEACAAFRAALERKPDYFNAAYALGRVSQDLGRTKDAILALEQAVAHGEGAGEDFLYQAYATLVGVLARASRREEARTFARKMVDRFPGRQEARRILESL